MGIKVLALIKIDPIKHSCWLNATGMCIPFFTTLGLFKCIVSDLFFYNNQKSATSVFVILPLQF